MPDFRRPWLPVSVMALLVWGTAVSVQVAGHAVRKSQPPPRQTPVRLAPSSDAAVCAQCHASTHQKWAGGRHSQMLQPATPASVMGRFSDGDITLRGARFSLSVVDGVYFVRGQFPGSREETHRVEFTLGSRRVQHYLARLPDGRLVVLPPTWDVEGASWFHNLDIVTP